MKQYQHFSDRDFAADASFLKWVKNPDIETTFFWETFLKNYPEKYEAVHNAREMILSINFKEDKLDANDIEELRRQIFKGIKDQNLAKKPTGYKKQTKRRTVAIDLLLKHRFKIAASIAIFSIIIFLLQLNTHPQQIKNTTAYGKIKTILLPDSSVVTLNANSTLTYDADWHKKDCREVWLKGEAYFFVKHQSDSQRFIVHAHELNVEVLGTEFNVVNRAGNAQVVLNTGSVKIDGAPGANISQITMQPGELVEFLGKDKVLRKRIVNPEVYSSWRKRLLTFENHSIQEVITLIENNFGVFIEVADASILDEQITGTLPSHDIDVVLSGLSKTFGMNISRDGDKVLIRKQE